MFHASSWLSDRSGPEGNGRYGRRVLEQKILIRRAIMAESNLNKPHFQDADKARQYLEAIRWPNGAICPHCGSVGKDHYELSGKTTRPGLWKCHDCREQFTVTVGTVF